MAAFVCSGSLAQAEGLSESKGLFDAVANVGELSALNYAGITMGGWLNGGITYNATDPGDNFNGTVTFGDRASEFQLNQLYFYLERAVATEGSEWDFGGRFDFLFGTDAHFTQAYGSIQSATRRGAWDLDLIGGERFYDIALPQAYLSLYAPVGNGLTAKIGHFYTIIGNEVVTAPDNFFYSHAYTMQYGEPFTHTGVLFSYPVNSNFTLNAGATTGSYTGGWDGAFDTALGAWAFLGGVTWKSDDKNTSVTFNATSGPVSEQDTNNWSMYSLVATHNITDKLHYTFQHDHGWVDKILGGQDAEWYGINNYLTYDLQEDLSVGLRAEWFRDDDGFRVFSRGRIFSAPQAGGSGRLGTISSLDSSGNVIGNNYFEITAGLNWKPLAWMTVRPNVRYDWTESANMFDCDPSGQCNQNQQWLFSTDVVMRF